MQKGRGMFGPCDSAHVALRHWKKKRCMHKHLLTRTCSWVPQAQNLGPGGYKERMKHGKQEPCHTKEHPGLSRPSIQVLHQMHFNTCQLNATPQALSWSSECHSPYRHLPSSDLSKCKASRWNQSYGTVTSTLPACSKHLSLLCTNHISAPNLPWQRSLDINNKQSLKLTQETCI